MRFFFGQKFPDGVLFLVISDFAFRYEILNKPFPIATFPIFSPSFKVLRYLAAPAHHLHQHLSKMKYYDVRRYFNLAPYSRSDSFERYSKGVFLHIRFLPVMQVLKFRLGKNLQTGATIFIVIFHIRIIHSYARLHTLNKKFYILQFFLRDIGIENMRKCIYPIIHISSITI